MKRPFINISTAAIGWCKCNLRGRFAVDRSIVSISIKKDRHPRVLEFGNK
jgi:hypothetical protein